MSEPIELTREERDAAVKTLREGTGRGFDTAVATVIGAINKVRAGDPVGTIRRHPSGNIVILTGGGWIWIDIRDGDTAESAPLCQQWPVIFTPEGSP